MTGYVLSMSLKVPLNFSLEGSNGRFLSSILFLREAAIIYVALLGTNRKMRNFEFTEKNIAYSSSMLARFG